MTPRENILEVINWGNPEYVPMNGEAFYACGLSTAPLIEQPWVSGKDPFGMDWLVTSMGAMHDVTKPPIIEDISEWRKCVKFPDTDKLDFTQTAADEMSEVDRENVLVTFYHPCGIFERLGAFMGFENALISLITEPDSCKEFFEALTDYKIRVANKIIDAYHPDVYVNFDDISNAKSTFMSPEVYRDVIKPYHAKFVKAVSDRGVIFSQHTCGKCETFLEDYVDMGVKIWSSAQIMNDIPEIQRRFKGRLVVEGGWDSSGEPGFVDASEEVIRKEVRRNISEYGKAGGFILMPTLFNENGNSLFFGDERMPALVDEWMKVRSFH